MKLTCSKSKITWLGSSLKRFSHGATVGQVYGAYKKLDDHLKKIRPDLVTDPVRIDELASRGEITPTMAEYFKQEISHSNEAKKTAEHWRRILWYVGVPLTILVGINTYYLEKEHAEHLQEHPYKPPNYPHLHIRNKVKKAESVSHLNLYYL